MRDLVTAANHTSEELRAARSRASGLTPASLTTLATLEAEFFTPTVRYSRPGLQTHITYLYSMSVGADQRVSQDAIERYEELRKALDSVNARAKTL